jgi:hypothetical protein
MFGRRGLIVLSLIAVTAVSAQAQTTSDTDLPGWSSCKELTDFCKDGDPGFIYSLAYRTTTTPSFLGTCYVHDDKECPTCACSQYVKVSYLPNPKGWDGGTGCISGSSPEESYTLAKEKLKELCSSGACCCPQVVTKPCAVQTPVKARDPITLSCCTFPNPCSAPTDWIAEDPQNPQCP